MKVLLTGGTGFLGRAVTRALRAHGHEVRRLVRGGPRPGLDGELVAGDVTDGDSVLRAAEGCGAILHAAALVKVWVPEREEYDRINLGGIRHALEAARRHGLRLVYTSSFMALGPSGDAPADESQVHVPGRYCNDYERTKALADEVARAADDVDRVLLYPGVVYGPGEMTDGNIVVKMVADHLAGRMPGIIGPGDRLWSYAYVDDVAEGHVAALERGRRGERYVLAGENATMNRLFALVEETAGVAPPSRHIPYPAAAVLGRLMWAWAELTGRPPELTHEVVDVFRHHWAYSSEKARRELGYQSRPLFEGLQQSVAWLRAGRAA